MKTVFAARRAGGTETGGGASEETACGDICAAVVNARRSKPDARQEDRRVFLMIVLPYGREKAALGEDRDVEAAGIVSRGIAVRGTK
jgi:hypothetical protein